MAIIAARESAHDTKYMKSNDETTKKTVSTAGKKEIKFQNFAGSRVRI